MKKLGVFILIVLSVSMFVSCEAIFKGRDEPEAVVPPANAGTDDIDKNSGTVQTDSFRLNISPKTANECEKITYTIPININYYMYDENLRNTLYWEIDSDGNTVSEIDGYEALMADYKKNMPKEGEVSRNKLTDIATGEVRCLVASRIANVREEEIGYAYDWESALFDVDGTQLTEWGDCDYSQAFGNYVIRSFSNYDSVHDAGMIRELWDFRKDRVIRDLTGDYSTMYVGCGGIPFKIHYEDENLILTKLDMDGNHLDSIDVGSGYWHLSDDEDLMVFTRRSYDSYVDDNARIRAIDVNLSDTALPLRYQIELSLYESWLSYEDDFFYIFTSPTGDGTWISNLYSKQASSPQVLLSDCAFIHVVEDDDSNSFILAESDSCVAVYDYELNRLFTSNPVPGIAGISSMDNGFYWYVVRDEISENIYDTLEGLLDSDFNIVIPADFDNPVSFYTTYLFIEGFYTTELISIHRRVGTEYVSSIYRLDGTLVMENLNQSYAVGPDRIAVRRGSYVGLIDWQGNWIVRRSVYVTLSD